MTHSFIVLMQAIFFIYSAYLAGILLLKMFRLEHLESLKRNVYAVMCGYGLYILIGFICGLLGLFDATALWIVTGAVLISSTPVIVRHFQSVAGYIMRPRDLMVRLRDLFRLNLLPKLLILAWLVANFFLVFVPVTAYDTLNYHLPIILNLIQEKRLTYTPNIAVYNSLPVFGEILYAAPTVMFGEATPDVYRILEYNDKTTMISDRKEVLMDKGAFTFQIIQYSLIILLSALLYEFTRNRVKNSFLAPVAVLVLLSVFDLWREVLHGGYIDVPMFLFCLASTFILIDICSDEKGDTKRFSAKLMFSAFFIGLALGMKYIALFFAFTNILLLLVYFWRQKVMVKNGAILFLEYAGIAFIIAGFWYVRNLISFANPVYPMFSVGQFNSAVSEFIMDRTVINFVLFPFYRYSGWFTSIYESSSRLIVLGYYVLLYGLGLFLLVVRKRFSLTEKLLFFSVMVISALFFVSSHIYRYMLPAVILVIPLLILFVDDFYEYLERSASAKFRAIFKKVSIWTVYLALFAVFLIGNFHFWKIRFTHVLGQSSVQEYERDIGSL